MDREYHLAAADFSENISETTCSCNAISLDKCCSLRSGHMFHEPFYLHPPASRLCDGIYINPMSSFISKPSKESKDTSFYLHSPHELVYTKITRLFCDKKPRKNLTEERDNTLMVNVDVHSNDTSHNYRSLSNESLVENESMKDTTQHVYEQIHMRPSETLSLKSISSNNKKACDVSSKCCRSGTSRIFSRSSSGSDSTSSRINNELQYLSTSIPAPAQFGSNEVICNEIPKPPDLSERNIKTSVELDKNAKISCEVKPALPPPPPPLPLPLRDADSSTIVKMVEAEKKKNKIESQVLSVTNKHEDVSSSFDHQLNQHQQQQQNFQIEVDKGVKIESDNKSSQVGHLINKHMVLPFIPPKFSNVADSNTLLKPSEYLRSICKATNKNTLSKARSVDNLDFRGISEVSEEVNECEVQTMTSSGPPPPPLPPQNSSAPRQEITTNVTTSKTQKKKTPQPLATISIQDLTSVQLRRTNIKMHAAKTFSTPPPRSVSMTNVSEPFFVQKTDLIAELKMTKNIPGIKKLKVEMAEVEKYQVKSIKSELNKAFSVSNFVDQIPEKDSSGNVIPIWKRQMLARKAAGRAKKELEEQIARDNEEKRQKAIPPWKRQLLAKKDSADIDKKAPLIDVPSVKIEKILTIQKEKHEQNPTEPENKKNRDANKKHHSDGDDNDNNNNDALIIPWRAQLRKTNSKLNILE